VKKITKKTQLIRNQILKDVVLHAHDIASHIATLFDISRQSVNKHLRALIDAEYLEASGSTRARIYKLGAKRSLSITLNLNGLSEHDVYTKYFSHITEGLRSGVEEIVFYGFTEILNNAIDHSDAQNCTIRMERNEKDLIISITDTGEGIFKRICRLMSLDDEAQALLELSKGKLTTDPDNHSGQGIFFTSRSFDYFVIHSFNQVFKHDHQIPVDLFMDGFDDSKVIEGTRILMAISLNSERTLSSVFDDYSAGEDEGYAFNRTVIPVRLAKYGTEQLVSRSQAKRVLSRIDSFKYVVMDFDQVPSIGQAFADEIFRVYALRCPDINISFCNASERVIQMILRANPDA
jgi:DNA-binding transcriptional ArsR family regulator